MSKGSTAKIILAVILCVVAVTVFASCQKSEKTLLKIGQKYLDELEYEKAALAFEQAIEVEPMNEQAYFGLYNVYCSTEDYDKAGEALYRGYKATNSEELWNELKKFEDTEIKVSHESGYYKDGINLAFTAGKGAEVYYNIGVKSEPTEKYTSPLKLDDGLYHVVVFAKGKYTGKTSRILEYEYITGPVPTKMEVAETFGLQYCEKYARIEGMLDGIISVKGRKSDLWGTTDIDFNEIKQCRSGTSDYSEKRFNGKKHEQAIKLYCREDGENDGMAYIYWLGKPIYDKKINYSETMKRITDWNMYWERVIPFADENGKLGVMNILGEVIVEPTYTGMINADNGMIIAIGKEGIVRLEAVYE